MTRQRTLRTKISALSTRAPFVAVLTIWIQLVVPATAQNPVPSTNEPLIPDAVAPGGTGVTLTVSGTGFVPASVVNWNGSARATTYISRSRLTAAIPASDLTTASTASVTVSTPSPAEAFPALYSSR